MSDHSLPTPRFRPVLLSLLLALGIALTLILHGEVSAHRSGCHRWHSCLSDHSTYVCGDLGYCSQCSDNEYCQGGKPRTLSSPQTPVPSPTLSPGTAGPSPQRPPLEPQGSRRADKKPWRIEEGTVTRVADGDTVTVTTPNQTKLRIRLFGIDAPETRKGNKFPGQPYGQEATSYLKNLVEGKQVRVEIYGSDRYHRLLGTLFFSSFEGRQYHTPNINRTMVEAGFAEVYRGPESGNPYKAQYQAAEVEAREAKRGMWVLGDTYESPRDYRRRVGISK